MTRPGVSVERIAEIRAAWKADREVRARWWRRHWRMCVFQALFDAFGGVVLGLALGLATFLWVLQQVVRAI